MTFPDWYVCLMAVVPLFLVLVAIALWQRPPCTYRGRVFYLATGFSGLWSSGVFLLFAFALWGELTPRRVTVYGPARLLEKEVLTPLCIGVACFAVGAWYLGRAWFGRSPPEEEHL